MSNQTEGKKDSAKEAMDLKTKTQAGKKAAAAKPVYPFSVAPGRSIITKSGVVDSGDEITANDLTGGSDTLGVLVEKGIVVKAKRDEK